MTPASGSVMRVRCPAKVNLHLQVVGRRPDGYHELRTIFQTIDLVDDLVVEVTTDGEVELEVTREEGVGELGSGADNLVAQAAEAALGAWGEGQGVRLRLHKRIPLGAGLGGGSSDAAGTLAALHHLVGRRNDRAEAWRLARTLGADVPFFLVGGTALGVGRGDEIFPLPDLEERTLGLALPEVEISSAGVYGALSEVEASPLDPAILEWVRSEDASWRTLPATRNDLEGPVLARHPRLVEVREALLGAGAESVQLSGSGSALFALYPLETGGARGPVELPGDVRYVEVKTLSRSGNWGAPG